MIFDIIFFGLIFADEVYLDFSGSSLYSKSQLENTSALLNKLVLGNPHSLNPSSKKTGEIVERVRREVLSFFNASSEKYSLVFTFNCTAALKMVGEMFPWKSGGKFVYHLFSHNSVLGIREYALDKGSAFHTFRELSDLQETLEQLFGSSSDEITDKEAFNSLQEPTRHLFAFPAECNFSGRKMPLEWISEIHKRSDERR